MHLHLRRVHLPCPLVMLHNIHSQKFRREDSILIEMICAVFQVKKIDQTKKLGKSGFCTLHLQRSLNSVIRDNDDASKVVTLKLMNLLLIIVHNLQEFFFCVPWNSWPLNFGYLFFRNTLYIYFLCVCEEGRGDQFFNLCIFLPMEGQKGEAIIFNNAPILFNDSLIYIYSLI